MDTPIVSENDRKARKHAQEKAWRLRNKERKRAHYKKWAAANQDKLLAKNRLYRKTHRESCLAYYRKRYAKILADPRRKAAHRGYVKTRNARKRGAPICDLTAAQWAEIKAVYGHRCVYCGRKMQRLSQDHITPLSKGGSHTRSNVVPACHSCNSRKQAGGVLCPVQPLLLTIA